MPIIVCIHANTFNNWPTWDISALQESVQQYLGNDITFSIKATCATRSRFLHVGTKSTNAYHHKHPDTVWGSTSYTTIIKHSSITSFYQLHTIYMSLVKIIITSKFHHHFKIDSLLPMVIKRKQATNQDWVCHHSRSCATNQHQKLSNFLCISESSYHPNLDGTWSHPTSLTMWHSIGQQTIT